ncbi:hypothetical protein SAMN05421853_102108 [Roseivivax halotolerans]|uniref:Uncharacterized protein n=1 Tax=Roseivivax halotolerans TaxID=93684 RepID=A0A1I5W3T1_9RHOB|nr:hypothetical protein [Roseivivax halotolerans]SFQ14379.1 hypothetical protein SAMN05421853_102108 [Roseivivax halotolerans]
MAIETLLKDLPDRIAAEIGTLLPELRECRAVAGRFDLQRLTSEGIAAPAVLVSLLRLSGNEEFAEHHHGFLLHMAAFVVTKDRMGLPRDAAAATIAQTLVSLIAETDWGLDDCGAAKDLRAEPLVSQGSLKSAASLWAVTWRQPCVFEAIDPGAPVPIQLYVGQAPDIGPGNEDAYDEIGSLA